jgi:hypothetical protein
MDPADARPEPEFARETRIRDLIAYRLGEFRQGEYLVGTEVGFPISRKRADLKTIGPGNVLRLYEFKLEADTSAIGQLLGYIALERLVSDFSRDICGVLAAFRFEDEVITTIRVMNLSIEIFTLPLHLARAGDLPAFTVQTPALPRFDGFSQNPEGRIS